MWCHFQNLFLFMKKSLCYLLNFGFFRLNKSNSESLYLYIHFNNMDPKHWEVLTDLISCQVNIIFSAYFVILFLTFLLAPYFVNYSKKKKWTNCVMITTEENYNFHHQAVEMQTISKIMLTSVWRPPILTFLLGGILRVHTLLAHSCLFKSIWLCSCSCHHHWQLSSKYWHKQSLFPIPSSKMGKSMISHAPVSQ